MENDTVFVDAVNDAVYINDTEYGSKSMKYVSPNGYSDDYGPNVANILKHGTRAIHGSIPARVRKDLREAVKDGVLGHMKKDGLKPEIFYHPQRRANAVAIRERDALYAIQCIKGVVC